MHAEARYGRFQAFVRAFYRQAGCEAPELDSGPDTAIAFRVDIDEVAFSIGYDPRAGEACLFIWCVLGDVPLDDEAALLRLLERNVAIARDHDACCCIDRESRQLALYSRKTMDEAEAEAGQLRTQLAHLAQLARDWRHHRFEDEAAGERSMAGFGTGLPWGLMA
jgi:hypothetical protein